MDINKGGPSQGVTNMEASNWRTQLTPDSRERVVNRIIDSIKQRIPTSQKVALSEIKKIAEKFEQKMYSAAIDQNDYLRRISVKMTTVDREAQNTVSDSLPLNSANTAAISLDSGQGAPSSIYANFERQLQGRQHLFQVLSQRPLNLQQDPYLKQGRLQQQEQKLSQPTQLQLSQNSVLQIPPVFRPSEIPSPSLPDLQQKEQSSTQQSLQSSSNPRTVPSKPRQPQQSPVIHQNRTPMSQQSLLPLRQEEQFMEQKPTATSIPQNQLKGKQDSVPDLQWRRQQQWRLPYQKDNFCNLQQQQLQGQKKFHSGSHQEQLHQQSNVSGLKQQCQQLLGSQCGNSIMQPVEGSEQQKTQQTASVLLPLQGQQSQPKPAEQKLMSQSQPEKLQQLPNSLQQDTDQRLRISDSTSEKRHANIVDWQEEVYQKVESLKSMYLKNLYEMREKLTKKLQQYDSLPQQPKTGQLEKFKKVKNELDSIIMHLNLPRSKFTPAYKEKLDMLRKRIIVVLYYIGQSKPVSSMPRGQVTSNAHSMQQSQRPHSQTPQVQPHSQTLQVQPPEYQKNPQLRSIKSESNATQDLKVKLGTGVKSEVLLQHQSAGQHSVHYHQPSKSGAPFPVSSPKLLQSASPYILQHSSPQIDQQSMQMSFKKAETPLPSANSLCTVSSPSTSLTPSPIPGDAKKLISDFFSLSKAGNIGYQQSGVPEPATSFVISTPGVSASSLLAESNDLDDTHFNESATSFGETSVAEIPIQRLVKLVNLMSPNALSASVSDIGSVISMTDMIAGSAPDNGSRAAVGEDLVAMTKSQARYFTGWNDTFGTRKLKHYTSAMPLNIVSLAASINDNFNCLDSSNLESTTTSGVKRPRIEVNHALLEEISEINQRLIDTVVDISDEDAFTTAAAGASEGEGTIVKCSFNAVCVSPNLKSYQASAHVSPILPLRLLVPANYPYCSPVLLDKLPLEISDQDHEDLSARIKSKLNVSLRSLQLQPVSLGEIARSWDLCAREVINEYAQKIGGGNFSSKYGAWENCLGAA